MNVIKAALSAFSKSVVSCFIVLACMVAMPITVVAQEWISLFDGKSLDGWTPKFTGYALGENYKNTFRVEEGLLSVSYDQYGGKFNNEFGHLFYKTPYSHYKLRATYRFLEPEVDLPSDMGWAFRNNGLMLHAQDPKTMTKDQAFPVSIEVQLLGGDGKAERSTLNLCTPGSDIVINGELHTDHCTNSSSDTYHGDQWVTVEIEVRGSEVIRHMVDGEVVLEYQQTQLDADTLESLGDFYGGKPMKHGYISIQAETHPTQFKKIELLVLSDTDAQ